MMKRCSCGSRDTRRSTRRGWLERRLLTMLRLKPYRCNRCSRRFFRFTFGNDTAIPHADSNR
ncbi:hypothetical protein [Lyngbya confervoides]|uniref:Transposase n=1 Tax=Lyngbya confervoides BDU141951 TaxID=1574623 RepID=A0ABD4SZL3_9CYAN|nr:hypothetical protein [Lyngbya confervoides]MCM1981713.1 hypothetical protein [Lyngbya confervoides BDU141951]